MNTMNSQHNCHPKEVSKIRVWFVSASGCFVSFGKGNFWVSFGTPQKLAFHQLNSWVPSFEAVRLQAKEEGEGESKGEGES